MSKPMKTALVGCGGISSNYLLSAQLIPRSIRFTKLMDVNEKNAAAQSKAFGIPYTTDFNDVIGDPDIEAVIVSVPHYLHKPLALRAAKAGKHVLLDKPMATTVADARAIIRACDRNNVRLSVMFPRRGMAANRLAQKIIRQGIIGDVTYVAIREYMNKEPEYWNTAWRASKEKAGGGCILMNISHTLDVLMMITGLRVKKVAGFVATLDTPVEVEDTGSASLQFDNGALGTVTALSIAHGMYGPYPEPMRIIGTHGQLILNNPVQVYTTKIRKGYVTGEWTDIPCKETLVVKKTGYRAGHYAGILKDTVAGIRKGGPVPCSGEEGLQSLQTVLGLYESSETGRTVVLK